MKENIKSIVKNVLLLAIICLTCCTSNSLKEKAIFKDQKLTDDLQIIDISQKQLSLFNKHLNTDSALRVKVFRDSLYYPYQDIWNGYVKNMETFDLVVEHYGIRQIEKLNEKNKLFYSGDNQTSLLEAFFKVKEGMSKLTGYSPKGKWYLLYGPALANLGSVGNGVMFIDFAFPENTDLNSVMNWFPHELNHQIYSNTSKDSIHHVLARCIDEGFAVYVNKLYWNNIANKKDYTLAKSLSWTEQELEIAEQNWDFIISYFKKHYLSEDREIIDKFGASNVRVKPNLPGAIGYYIGYKMVEEYVILHGTESWKDIYKMSYNELLEKSKFF